MALGVFFEDRIKATLLSLASAGRHRGPEYHEALRDVALALSLELAPAIWRVVAVALALDVEETR